MLKYILLGTAMCIASPAFAQETPATDTATQGQTPVTEPAGEAQPAPQPAEAAKPATVAATPAPATEATQPTPVAEAAQPAPAQPVAAAQPAPAPAAPQPASARIATIVNTEFANYDKNGDGMLDQSEFGTWMVALRVAAQPEFVADSPQGKSWVVAAFKQADTDKSASVNAAELTKFLTPKDAA